MSSYQVSPNNNFDRVVRFRDQKGLLGVSSQFLLEILDFYRLGSSPPNQLEHPLDVHGFSRIGMLIICRPELEPYLQIVKYLSLKWYNIIGRWDLLIKHFFYENKLSNDQLNSLLTGIMDIPQPDVDFCWPFDQEEVKEEVKEDKSSWMTEMNQKKQDFFVIEEPSFPEEPVDGEDPHSLIEEGSKEIADQLSDNLNALNEMEITSEVAKLLIPTIIRKFEQKVNISWSWTSGKEKDDVGGWQNIYEAGDDHHDIPHQIGVVGCLEINKPISVELESKGMLDMLHLMKRQGRQNKHSEEDLSTTLELIKQLEKSERGDLR